MLEKKQFETNEMAINISDMKNGRYKIDAGCIKKIFLEAFQNNFEFFVIFNSSDEQIDQNNTQKNQHDRFFIANRRPQRNENKKKQR